MRSAWSSRLLFRTGSDSDGDRQPLWLSSAVLGPSPGRESPLPPAGQDEEPQAYGCQQQPRLVGRPLAEQVGSPLSPRAFPFLGKLSLSRWGQARGPGMQSLLGWS